MPVNIDYKRLARLIAIEINYFGSLDRIIDGSYDDGSHRRGIDYRFITTNLGYLGIEKPNQFWKLEGLLRALSPWTLFKEPITPTRNPHRRETKRLLKESEPKTITYKP